MKTAMIVGGSRGLGRGIAQAFSDDGAKVITVARNGATESADATDPAVAQRLLDRHRPGVLVIAAGAVPPMAPLHEYTWDEFSVPWQQDVRIAFTWLGAVLRRPLAPGSAVVVLASAASLRGSPLSGGYAGAKATVRLITGYARGQAHGTGVTFTAILPGLAPETAVGATAVHSYAGQQGISEADFAARLPAPLTPQVAGASVVHLLARPADQVAEAYLLDGAGLHEL
ncbi:SDR family oxidoreductase [Actinoplanes sp. NPDC026619]|uniref:SDR family oxidoreductase n=1 Tax=Actinoplanes sp. NPDC026619 TaxID=3155798 RepID=UPI0033EFBF2D